MPRGKSDARNDIGIILPPGPPDKSPDDAPGPFAPHATADGVGVPCFDHERRAERRASEDASETDSRRRGYDARKGPLRTQAESRENTMVPHRRFSSRAGW